MNLSFDVSGSAQLGLDYIIESNNITIPAGQDFVSVPISIISDDITEGVETIEFNFPFIDICSAWPTQITVQIYEPTVLTVDVDEELVLCADESNTGTLEGYFNGGIGLVNYGWYYDDVLISSAMDLSTDGLAPGVYTLIADDECGN